MLRPIARRRLRDRSRGRPGRARLSVVPIGPHRTLTARLEAVSFPFLPRQGFLKTVWWFTLFSRLLFLKTGPARTTPCPPEGRSREGSGCSLLTPTPSTSLALLRAP